MKSYKEITKSINEYRLQTSSASISQRALEQKFREYPYGQKILNNLIKHNIILRHASGYTFSNIPIHITRIESIVDPIRNYYRSYNKKNSKEQSYIKYLQSRGYCISKIEYYD